MAVGNMQFGTTNNADVDGTELTSTARTTLLVANTHAPFGTAIVGQMGTGVGVHGISDSHIGVGGTGRTGVYGTSRDGSGVYGVSGYVGVYGEVTGQGIGTPGVYGTSKGGDGVKGWVPGPKHSGVIGATADGSGVTGEAGGKGIGVSAKAFRGYGLIADTEKGPAAILATNYQTTPAYGVYASVPNGIAAIYGTGRDAGVRGHTANGNGVLGVSTGAMGSDTGVRGEARGSDGIGVAGVSDNGKNAWGIYGQSLQGKAGVFGGDVVVTGVLTKPGGGFLIDHPLDPANKYLYHSFVESPEMLNVYSGNTITDARGEAVILLPDYFEALNRDFRYQLTVVGQFAQAIVADEIRDNQFRIRTDKPNVKVSWQVTGIRQDAWAKAHAVVAEVDKPDDERGTYLSPREHNQPETSQTFYERTRVARERSREPLVDIDDEEIRAAQQDRSASGPLLPPAKL